MKSKPEMTIIQLLQYLASNTPKSQSIDYEYDDTVYIDKDGYVYNGNDTDVIDKYQHNYSWASYSIDYDNGISLSYIYDASVIIDDDNVVDVKIGPHPYPYQSYNSHTHAGLCIEGVTLTDYVNLSDAWCDGTYQYVWNWIAAEFERMQDGPEQAVREELKKLHS